MSSPASPIATTVTGNPPPAAAPPAAAPPAAAPPAATADDLAAIRKELDTLKSRNQELERTAQFWFDKASKGGQPAEKKDDPPADDVDLLDVITTKGSKGLDEVLEKRGFVRADQVDSKIETRAQQLVRENALVEKYPDLKNHDSDFFKATAENYAALKKQGVSETMAMEMAAERTELKFLREGKLKTKAQATEEDKQRREEERQARIRAQSGDRGGRPSEASEDDEELTAEQKHIAAQMGITEESYKARAKKGVAIRGGLR